MNTAIESIPIRFAGWQKTGSIPAWAKGWNASRTTVWEICKAKPSRGIVVIHSKSPDELTSQWQTLAEDAAGMDGQAGLVLDFSKSGELEAGELARILKLFPQGPSKIDFAWGGDLLKHSVIKAAARYLAEQEEESPQFPDPLAGVKEVIEATKDLRAPSGRLSATATAAAFGLSTARLGQIIGRSRQSLGKTPDALAVQPGLRPFERIARLRVVLRDEKFRAWLHRSNRHLDGAVPFDLICDGRAAAVADLAEDMLLGTPG